MANVHDVAAYILENQGQMSTMKLQKLCYYSQGWSLAWDERPLFKEEIQAWANGPVVYSLFDKHRGQFTVDTWTYGDANAINGDEKDTIDAVLKSYGMLSGQQLSDKTHQESPWLEARDGMAIGARSNAPVSLDIMQEFFSGLASAK
ncbi:type II toxin-antitoxin system antitoxin SocA domain-containing protein [Cryobacterium sp. MDB2-33-2]|uniref:Panacea domain-containing protein n=1 Tax=Cryobacterium sp. MDB2-33-2 TaxID=1259179 RepID=UPI00106A5FDA|nr:type II toxin-antitoxin system antitoxin SocA domain-containing protein [Cryobacterium sp. MDB2-33-2]TFC02319.1 DUF4065 domain-containing protein [Cryobacterium sp. MDB2-33-2]